VIGIAAIDQELRHGRILEDGDPMVDPLDAQRFDVVPDGRRRTVLALVRGEAQPGSSGETIGIRVLGRVDAQLGGVHSEPDDAFRHPAPPQLDQTFNELETGPAPERPVHVADEHHPQPGLLLTGDQAVL